MQKVPFNRLGMRALRLDDQRGAALVMVLLVAVILVGLGGVAIAVSNSETRASGNYESSIQAKYFAESELDRTIGLQNDLTRSPRFLLDPNTYISRSDTLSVMSPQVAVEPLTSGDEIVGLVSTRIIGKDPVTTPAPFVIRSTAVLNDSSSTTYQAVLDVLSLLDFAVFSDAQINIAPNITIGGRVYSRSNVRLTGPTATFLQRVEYVGNLQNSSWGVFQYGHGQVPMLPQIGALVNMGFYENASKSAGVCTDDRGLYIGFDGGAAVDAQTTALFHDNNGQKPNSQSGCRNGGNCKVIDLSLFDFSANPITYNGVALIGFDGTLLTNFNGVIFVDDELHIWGHLGQRSVEDETILDTRGYMTPPMIGTNVYSNNTLDAGEDGLNGGLSDGILNLPLRGLSIGIYVDDDIFIDHNIWAGVDAAGRPVRMALVADDDVRIDPHSPRAVIVEAAVLAVTGTWRPLGSSGDRQPNEWANARGSLAPNSYPFDLNGNGALQVDNGVGQPGDRNEHNMEWAWTLRNEGNLVVTTSPSSGPWSSGGHPRYYNYDQMLRTSEIPCYPTLPLYGVVPGTFTEMLSP